MSEKRCCDCEHFGLSKDPIFRVVTGICGRCGKEVGYTEQCLFEEERNKGDESMDKESFLKDVYQIMKEDGIIDVMGGLFLLLGFWVALYIITYFIVFIRGIIL